jgi:hypothetical protein
MELNSINCTELYEYQSTELALEYFMTKINRLYDYAFPLKFFTDKSYKEK